MVRNEKNPRGDSIAERYGPPVTASDVEDLLYRERVPAASIYKIMQAVRAALNWHRSAVVRPWAGELEDGLTRQEERRAEERRQRLREQLIADGRAAAAGPAEAQGVNSPEPEPEPAVPDVSDEAAVKVPDSHVEAPEVLAEVITLRGAERTAPEAAEVLYGGAEDIAADAGAAAAGAAGGEAAYEAPAVPPPVAEAPVQVPASAAVPEAPVRVSDVSDAGEAEVKLKTCSRCRREWPPDFFQRDKRASDGRRPNCKKCSAIYDAMRASLRKSLRKAAQDAASAGLDAAVRLEAPVKVPDSALEAPAAAAEVIVPEEAPEAASVAVRAVCELHRAEPDSITVAGTEEALPGLVTEPASEAESPEDAEPEDARFPEDWRLCRKCGIMKAPGDFYIRTDGRSRYACRACEIAVSAHRRQAAREKRLAAAAAAAAATADGGDAVA